jgi:hypothetical protein
MKDFMRSEPGVPAVVDRGTFQGRPSYGNARMSELTGDEQ